MSRRFETYTAVDWQHRARHSYATAIALGALAVGILIGAFLFNATTTKTITNTVVHTATPTCHPVLLSIDLAVMIHGYDLAVTNHHPHQALTYVGRHFAAIDPNECRLRPVPSPLARQ